MNLTSLFAICDVIELYYIDVYIFLIDAAVLIVYQIHYISDIVWFLHIVGTQHFKSTGDKREISGTAKLQLCLAALLSGMHLSLLLLLVAV